MKNEPPDNTLAEKVADSRWSRRSTMFQTLGASTDLKDFSELAIKDLQLLFTGTYQLNFLAPYLAKMIGKDGSLDILYLRENPEIIRVKVQSRH